MATDDDARIAGFKDTTDAVAAQTKILEAGFTRSDAIGVLGKRRRHYVRTEASGKWVADVPRDDPRGVHALRELSEPSRRLHVERAAEIAPPPARARMRTADGRVVAVHEENQRWLHQATGALPVASFTGGVRVVSGPDGMLWRDIAGYWVPTGRTCLGTPVDGSSGVAEGPQRDPAGNMWEVNPETGEWEIRLYAEEVD